MKSLDLLTRSELINVFFANKKLQEMVHDCIMSELEFTNGKTEDALEFYSDIANCVEYFLTCYLYEEMDGDYFVDDNYILYQNVHIVKCFK
jgi:hypothetical protein